jgi:hypothetical protein
MLSLFYFIPAYIAVDTEENKTGRPPVAPPKQVNDYLMTLSVTRTQAEDEGLRSAWNERSPSGGDTVKADKLRRRASDRRRGLVAASPAIL